MKHRLLLLPIIALFTSGCSCSFSLFSTSSSEISGGGEGGWTTSIDTSSGTTTYSGTSSSSVASTSELPPKQTDFIYEIETYQEEEYAKITGVNLDTSITELTIPNTLDGYKVGIYQSGLLKDFSQLETLKTSVISTSFNTVNELYYLFGWKSYIPASLVNLEIDSPNIYRGTITYFDNLKTLTFTNVNDSIYVGHLSALTKVVLNNVTYLSSEFLQDTHALEEIKVNGGNFVLNKGNLYDKDLKVLYRAFSPIEDLYYIAPESLTTVGTYAFQNCSLVQSIYLGYNCTSLGYGVFKECESLQNLTLSRANARLTSLFGSTLPTYLTEVKVLGGTTICSYFFANVSSVPSLKLPNSITTVESYAFYNCTSLTEINLPNVYSIGACAFKGCTATVYSFSSSSYTYGESAFEGSSITSFTFPSSVKYISKNLFKNCTSLTNVTMPSELIGIEESAFEGCTKLSSISFTNLNYIEKNAFKGCTSLEAITFPSITKEIRESAFEGCTNLKSINLSNASLSLGTKAFYGCSKLTSISNTSNVTLVGRYCFADTTNAFTTAYFPNAQIQAFAFSGWSYLQTLTLKYLPSGGTIPMLFSTTSFANTYNVTYSESGTTYSYYVPNSLTSLVIKGESSIAKRYASNMTSLTEVSLNEGIHTIYSNVFSGCTNIDHLYLPNSITEIQSYAFTQLYNCRYIDSDPEYSRLNKRSLTIAKTAFSFKKLEWFVVPCGGLASYADNAIMIAQGSSTTPSFFTASVPGSHDRTNPSDSWYKGSEKWINTTGQRKVYTVYCSEKPVYPTSENWYYQDGKAVPCI